MTTDTGKITEAANALADGLSKGGGAARTLGQEIVNVFAGLDARISALEAGSPPVEPPSGQVGLITDFQGTLNDIFYVDSLQFSVNGAARPYSMTNPDPYTLRFEVRQGDHAWGAESDVSLAQYQGAKFPTGSELDISFRLKVEPNGPNNSLVNGAGWFVLGEIASTHPTPHSPCFALELIGDRLRVNIRYVNPGGNPSNSSSDLQFRTLWNDPRPLPLGQYLDIGIRAKVSNAGGGYVRVWRGGEQVVDYSGPIGYGDDLYWNYGTYRETRPETVIGSYKNFSLRAV
jgi:hypothetical protein